MNTLRHSYERRNLNLLESVHAAGRVLGEINSECPLCSVSFSTCLSCFSPKLQLVSLLLAGRALGEADTECPLCSPGFRSVLDIRAAMRAGASEQARHLVSTSPFLRCLSTAALRRLFQGNPVLQCGDIRARMPYWRPHKT